MLELYIALVKNQRKTLDEVPEKFREAVKDALGVDEQQGVAKLDEGG